MTIPIGCSPFPIFRAFSTTGQPLAGGQLFTFAAGTTTPLASYTDNTGGTPNANPVVLDSTGSAPVFLTNVPYKLILKDSNGVTQWTEDNVYASAFVSAALGPVVGAATTAAALAALGGVTSATVASMIGAAINNYVLDTGTADAYVVALSPPITSYTNGLTVKVKITGGTNITTTPTLDAGGGAKTIVNNAGGALKASDILNNSVITVTYDASSTHWYLSELVLSQIATPLITPPLKGFNNLKIIWASNTSLTITADNAIVNVPASTTNYFLSAINQTLNTGTAGAGGLDAGSLSASVWYYVYLIYNPTGPTVSSLISLSATAPTLPTGYTAWCRVGTALTDGSKNLVGFIQWGKCWQYVVGQNLAAIPVLTSGTAGDILVPTWVATAWGSFAPPTASKIKLYANSGGSGSVFVAPNGNYAAADGGGGFAVANCAPLALTEASNVFVNVLGELLLESNNLYYAAVSGGHPAVVNVLGYEDNL